MQQWDAELTTDVGDLAAAEIESLTEALPGFAVVTYDASSGLARLCLTIDAPDTWAATDECKAAVTAVEQAIGRPVTVLAVRVHPAGDDPIRLDLVGYAEIAAMADPPLSRQRARQVAADNPRFPEPVGSTSNGPVYLRAAVEQFLETWERRPGRAAKST